MTGRSPRIEKWREQAGLGADHAAFDLSPDDAIAPALEYFLGLEDVPGFDEKLRQLEDECKGPPRKNTHLVRWATFCAELGAIFLLGEQLSLPLLGLDRPSPRASTRDCDIVAEVEGRAIYFEVKRRANEDCQFPPPHLLDRISKLRLPYQLSIELHDRGYDCTDLDEQLVLLQEHLNFFCHHEDRDLSLQGDTVPPPFNAPSFSLWFHEGHPEDGIAEFFDPMTEDDVRSWLLEEGRSNSDGEPMIPMVQKAVAKGADYLMCRVSPGGPWAEFGQGVFASASPINSRAFSVDDPALAGLQGVILFSKYDNFCIVNRATADQALLR